MKKLIPIIVVVSVILIGNYLFAKDSNLGLALKFGAPCPCGK